ncbi:MAG: GntR family transcriptional regulator [Clostridiales bacterium]|nr:GntR family transcriptional regulator [Clostridiales bacterium]
MEFEKITKVNLVDSVCKQLRERILSGKYPEGTRLDGENKLAASFNVSRVVIREALRQLRSERLIITRQGMGTFIANPSNFLKDQVIDLTEQGYLEFWDFRRSVEYSAVAIAKKTACESDFEEIERCIQKIKECEQDVGSLSEADYQFHLTVVSCSHNVYLENAMKINKNMLVSVLYAMNSLPQAYGYMSHSHVNVARCLKNRDPEGIIEQYEEMRKYNISRLEEYFKNTEM